MTDEVFEQIVNNESYSSKGIGIAVGDIYGDGYALVVNRYNIYRIYSLSDMSSRDIDLFADLPLLKHFKIKEVRWC